MAHKETEYGLMDIPLSCSMFLEPALKRYVRNISPLSAETKELVHEWNRALVDILKTSRYSVHLGDLGRKILSRTLKYNEFPAKCVENAKDVRLQALHYALRFSDSMRFLVNKITCDTNTDIKFVDLGCGFSPLGPVIQAEYNLQDVYCIDVIPEIVDVYTRASEMVSGRAPTPISWTDAQTLAKQKKLNTIVAMGVLPWIQIKDQVSRLKFIDGHFDNYLVEIKYNNDATTAGQNVFNLEMLQRLRMDATNAQTLETTVIQNSLRYLHKFLCTMPNQRDFVAHDRSLFLSR